MNNLISNGTFGTFADKLKESKQIPYFKNLVGSISKETLSTNNVAWKSALYQAKWSECGSTHAMRFDLEFTEYWSIMQILFGSSAINVLCGPGHFGKIVDQILEKGKFTPDEGLCNFAIPSCRTLSKLDIGYDKEIPCGTIKHTLDIAEAQCKENPNK